MSVKLYDLCSADEEVRFSPPCWMVKFALLHKGVSFETVPLRFTEKENYPDPEYGLMPVLDDNGKMIKDSAAIVAHLDQAYPENPIFVSDGEKAAHGFYTAFAGAHLFSSLAPMLFWRIEKTLTPKDAAYFRESREKRLGVTLEEFAANPDLRENMEGALKVLSAAVENNAYFGGDAPNLSDYFFAGAFMWQRTITTEELYEPPQALSDWFDRILNLYDGYARKAKRASFAE